MSGKPRGTEGTQQACGEVRELARDGDARISQCSCGTVHLHLGPVSHRLTPERFAELMRAIAAIRGPISAARESTEAEPTDSSRRIVN